MAMLILSFYEKKTNLIKAKCLEREGIGFKNFFKKLPEIKGIESRKMET